MQIYSEIPVITASPNNEDKNIIPHHLYNYLSITQNFSAGDYIKAVQQKIEDMHKRGKRAIIVGGTGMYISALIKPFVDIEDIEDEIRNNARKLLEAIGKEAFYQELLKLDPKIDGHILASDGQRMLRAYEVFKQTGKSLIELQQTNISHPILQDYTIIMLHPERSYLHQNCNIRFEQMLHNGALKEAEYCMNIPGLGISAQKALGLSSLIKYISGEISLEEATIEAQTKTRQYAKRQITWFKNQIPDKITIAYNNADELSQSLNNLIKQCS